jgi:SAM-dependent methyltransferase
LINTLKRIARQTLPESILMGYRANKTVLTAPLYEKRNVKEVFAKIYRQGTWGGRKGELYSGEGSDGWYADQYAAHFRPILAGTGVRTLADLGCGDFKVGKRLAEGLSLYVGVDIVPDVVRENQSQFASNRVRFVCADITKESLPTADACVVRQVLQHLTNAEICGVLHNICKTYSRAYVTEHVYAGPGVKWNVDIPHGPNTRVPFRSGVNVLHAPFFMAGRHLFDIEYPSGFGGRFQVFRTWEIATRQA